MTGITQQSKVQEMKHSNMNYKNDQKFAWFHIVYTQVIFIPLQISIHYTIS